MRGLFGYDTPFGRVMCFITDLILLNLLFLVCCLPVVTIGAAQSGLYYGVRTLRDPEDDRSCYKLFFKGFAAGFWRITLVWCIFLVFNGILAYTMLMCFANAGNGLLMPWGIPAAGLIFGLILHSLLTIFHSQFSCGSMQLVRNSLILFFTNPFHSILVAVLTWVPLVIALVQPNLFLDLVPVVLLAYYSLAMLVGSTVMKKPFQRLIDYMEGEDVEVREDEEIQTEK